jgi:phage baseplate assembly protein gpV
MDVASTFARRGRVERIEDDEVEIRLEGSHEVRWASLALPSAETPGVGDEVLLIGQEGCEAFVVAVLGRSRPGARRLELASGARAEVASSDPEVLRIFSTEGELVVEYDAALGRAQVRTGRGDLEVIAEAGNLRLAAAHTLQLEAERIDARSREINLETGDGASRSSLALSASGARLAGPLVEMVAKRLEQRAGELRQTVQRLVTHASDVQLVVERLETIAGQVRERAKRTYRVVEELAQLRAGRLRTFIASTYHLKAHKTVMRSTRDFKVKADQIHLG